MRYRRNTSEAYTPNQKLSKTHTSSLFRSPKPFKSEPSEDETHRTITSLYGYPFNIADTPKSQTLQKKQVVKSVLGKIIFSKQLSFKKIFARFRSLMTGEIRYRVEQKTNPEEIFSSNLIWNTKLNIQTSLMRTILNVSKKKNEVEQKIQEVVQGKNHMLKKEQCLSIAIYPDELVNQKNKEKEAIFMLIPFTERKIKKVIQKFKKNVEAVNIKEMYCEKVYKNLMEGPRHFIEKVRLIIKLDREHILATKRKIMSDLLNKCLDRRDRTLIQDLKMCHAIVEIKKREICKKILAKASLRKLQSLGLWHRNVANQKLKTSQIHSEIKMKSPNKQILKKFISPHLQEERKKSLKRIFLGYYLEKWMYHARFRKNLEKCAVKFACAPPISLQRAFWRMNINAYHKE